jgi:hypothetical protein
MTPETPTNRPTICENPGCRRTVTDSWEETARYCPDCSVQIDLFDRQGRWERLAFLHRVDQLRLALGTLG